MEIGMNMDQIKRFSPEFNAMKLNNYDNHLKHAPRTVTEKFSISKHLATTLESSLDLSKTANTNICSSVGVGGRAFLYAATPRKFDKSSEPSIPSIKSKVDFRKT
jgi:hypothetical protein